MSSKINEKYHIIGKRKGKSEREKRIRGTADEHE